MVVRRMVAKLALRISGYKLIGHQVPDQAGIFIGAPHTSQWDFVAFVIVAWYHQVNLRILMKKSMFAFKPFGAFLRALGGIPIDRDNPQGLVQRLVCEAKAGHKFQLVLAPKGTRSQRPYWKSGFYRLALETSLPLTLASIDSTRREIEIGPTLQLSGNISADMNAIREFYADKAGVRPQLRSEPRLRSEDEPDV